MELSKNFDEKIMLWTAYYRNNIHRFAEEYLGLHLKLFQKFLLYMMNSSTMTVIITCRGLGKTFITALFCCIRCILYPGTSIFVCSKTKKQGMELVKKISDILMPNSPMLRMEVSGIKLNQYDTEVSFKNGSSIRVGCANQNARGVAESALSSGNRRVINGEKIWKAAMPIRAEVV